MKRLTYLLPALLLMLCACKPTEKNYRAAYEAAQAKKAAEREADAELGLPELTSTEGPRRQRVGLDTAYVFREPLTLHGDAPAKGAPAACVAVGKYKMTANAQSDADALEKEGYDAFLLATPRGEFYTCIGSAPTLSEAVKMMREFMRKHPGRPYIGLPGEPVIEIPTGTGL